MALTIATNKNWSDYEANSTTSLVIGSGSLTALTLTIETGKAYTVGDDIALVPLLAKIPMTLIGIVTSYDPLTGVLVVNCTRIESAIPSWDLVSSSSNTIGTGAKTFVTFNGKSALLAAADNIMVGRKGTGGGNRFVGTVTSYSNTDGTLVMNCTSTVGSGTAQTDWVIVSSGTFSAWKIVPSPVATINLLTTANLTFDTEPSYPIGSLSSMDRGRFIFTNASTTTPWVIEMATRNANGSKLFQLENNGRLDVTGASITVKTGDGTANQTVDFSASPLTKIDFPAIEVETGSGTGVYRPWYVFESGAPDRGYIGKNWMSRGLKNFFTGATSATVTLTTASPTVITWNSHGLRPGNRVRFTTTGTYTGISTGTDYYVLVEGFTTNTFRIGASVTTAAINVTAQSGTHTCSSLAEFGTGLHGNAAMFNPTTRILTFGNGTQGNVVPTGAKVRIPNIHFTSEYPRTPIMSAISSATAGVSVTFGVGNPSNIQTNTGMTFFINQEEFTGTVSGSTMTGATRALNGTVAANHAQGDTLYSNITATASTTSNRAIFDVSDGGIVNLSRCSFGNVYLVLSNGQNASLSNVWVSGACSIGATTADVTVNGLYCSPWPQSDGTGIVITSILGATSVQNVYNASTASSANTNASGVQLTSLQNATVISGIEGFVTARNGTATSCNAVLLQSVVANSIISNITAIGARFSVTALSRFEVDEIIHGGESSGVVSLNVTQSGLTVSNCQYAVFRNFSKAAGGAAPRGQIISTDTTCTNIVIHSCTYDAASHANPALSPSGNNIILANSTFGTFGDRGSTGSGTGVISNASTGDTVVIRNCTFTAGDGYGADNGNGATARCFLEQTTGHSMWWRAAGSAFDGNYQEMGPFHVLLDNGVKNTGTLTAQFSVKASRDIYDLNGGAYLNNGGSVFLPITGDYIILKSYQNLRTITGFTGVVDPEDVNNSNLSYSFELVGHESTFTDTYTSLTTANLNAALSAISGYSDYNGFKIRLKITAIADSASNQVINVRMFTTNNAATVLPIGYTAYTLTGIIPGTTVAAFIGTEEVAYEASASGTVTLSLPYEFDGNMASVTMKIRKQNYSWDGHIATYNQYAFTRASLQALDASVIETDPGVLDLYTDLNNTTNIYDYVKYWGTKRANLLVPQLCTSINSNLDFGSYDLVFDATASELLSVTGNTVTFKTTELLYEKITTTGTVDFVNGSVNKTVVSSAAGTSAVISIFYGDLDGYKIYLEDNMGVQQDYQTISGVEYIFYLPPPASGNWRWRAVRYGMLPETGLLDVSNGGRLEFTLEGNYDTSIVESNLATVLAYTALETLEKQYDYCQAFLTTGSGKALGRIVSKSGSSLDYGSYSVTYNATASSVFTQVASLLTIKAPTVNGSGTIATTGTILFVNGCITYISYYDSTGPHLIGIGTVSGFVPNTRIIVHNVTKGLTKHDALTTGTLSFVYENGTDYSVGDTVNIYHAYYGGTSAMKKEMVSTTVSVSGWSAVIAQTVCGVYAAYYNTYNTDGATVYATGDFVKDGTNLQIDLNDGDNLWYAHRLFMWDKYQIWFNSGNRSFFTQVVAPDAGNISIGTLMLDNLNSTTAYQGDVINITNSTSTLPVVNPTTGGGGITMYSGGKVLTTSSGDVAPSEAQIKAWVRAELATEMARLDASITSRNAIAPDNSSISLIKNKVDQITITGGNVNSVIDTTLLAKEATSKKIKGMVSTII